ncbi:hypothetical protein [Sphingobium vermicomposti]|uniref:Type IV secretory pathway VirB10-like protein n=1 Tax=Sphingobium vermicomposti TaxID=529005 RepID=A0A846M4E2_9SPHN|nr:hypothetical protein [Sphingobium vermicomposti]NIJ16769.1 type IV secretory pathway VirB10-like protein [Sphingobium vermicomposti]
MRIIALAALAGALALSACGKKDEAPVVNNMVEPPVENVIIEEPEAPLPPPSNTTTAPEPAPPPTVSELQQIQDDAAATGMTARLDRSTDDADNAIN